MLMKVCIDCCCDHFSYMCRGWSSYYGMIKNFGSVPNAVSPASKPEPRMRMRVAMKLEKETERARRGHSSTLHADIATSCGSERETRDEPRLRNEGAAGGLTIHRARGELEPRLRSWMARPSAPGVVKDKEASRDAVTEKTSQADQVDDAKVPGAPGQCRLVCRHGNGARGRQSQRAGRAGLVDRSGD